MDGALSRRAGRAPAPPLVLLLSFLLLAGLLLPSSASADSWSDPETRTYLSENRQLRLTVIPSLGKRGPAAGQTVDPRAQRDRAVGVLERKTGRDWQGVWTRPLSNIVAPTKALVTNNGQRIVTFDNWYNTGIGKDVVAIYGPDGRPIRAYGLADLMPQSYVDALPHSVSSIQWYGEHILSPDERKVIVRIVDVTTDYPNIRYHDLPIDLATGKAEPFQGPERGLASPVTIGIAVLAALASILALSRFRRRHADA